MKNLKCMLGFHNTELIRTQQTKEIDSVSGVNLVRNVKVCKNCEHISFERIEGLIFVKDNGYIWKPTIAELLCEHYEKEEQLK